MWKGVRLMYKTLIKPVVMYDSETWVLSQAEIERLKTFQGRILRRIYDPMVE